MKFDWEKYWIAKNLFLDFSKNKYRFTSCIRPPNCLKKKLAQDKRPVDFSPFIQFTV